MNAVLQSIITAIVTGGVTLLGVLISNNTRQAVIETRLDALTEEVREHNNYAHRVPILENRLDAVEKKLEKLEDDIK